MARILKSTEYLRHDFTQPELLELGGQLAEAYQSLDQIENEEAAIKAQIKERKSGVQLKIGTLSRNISARFDMQNVECRWDYGKPNAGEVSCFRIDTGAFVKARAMTGQERQEEIKFDEPVAANPQKPEETQAAVEEFFDPDKFPEGYIIDAEFVDPEVDTHQEEIDDAANDHGQAVPEPETPAEPEASRQRLLTMKGRKKKDAELAAGKSPSGEDFDF